jgi:hypothetical protein
MCEPVMSRILPGARIGQVMSLAFVGDVITTGLVLGLGGYESNLGIHPIINPVNLVATGTLAWPAAMIMLLVLVLATGLVLNTQYKNSVGVLVWVVPLYIESAAVWNNLNVAVHVLI